MSLCLYTIILNSVNRPPRHTFTWIVFWSGVAQSVQRLATGWAVRGSNPGGGEIFRTRPDRPWGPTSLLYNGYRVFPGVKAAGAWRWPPTPTSAEVKERVELYLYSPSGSPWPVLGWTWFFREMSWQANQQSASRVGHRSVEVGLIMNHSINSSWQEVQMGRDNT